MTSPDTARLLGQSPSWVYKWRRRWVLEEFSFEDQGALVCVENLPLR